MPLTDADGNVVDADPNLRPHPATIDSVVAAVVHARTKHPTPEAKLAALMEEVGELAKALLEKDGPGVWAEAAQVAAVAIRILEEGDSCFPHFVPAVHPQEGLLLTYRDETYVRDPFRRHLAVAADIRDLRTRIPRRPDEERELLDELAALWEKLTEGERALLRSLSATWPPLCPSSDPHD